MIRTYSELSELDTFEERYLYLRLSGQVGVETFGFDRHLNQRFYKSKEWQDIRHHVIARDSGLDLGIEGFDIRANILIHHMNPIQERDLSEYNPDILNPEFLITTKHETHNAIHFGSDLIIPTYTPRAPGDTTLW